MTDEWIIKFPASDEMKDSGTMEKAYMDCAADCGIIVPETKLMPSSAVSYTHLDVYKRQGYYCALAKREGIPFSAQIDLPQTLPVDEIDMGLVLSNLLENALEASFRTAPARRQIKVKAYVHAEKLL